MAPIIPSDLTTKPTGEWNATEVNAFLQANKVRYKLDDVTIQNLVDVDVEGDDFIGFDADGLKLFSLGTLQASRILRLRNDLMTPASAAPSMGSFKHETPKELSYTPRLNGIGGTNFMGHDLDGAAYEGINLKSSDYCRREHTVEKLKKKLDEGHVLLVRSPPMSGKTSLSQLLEQRLLQNPGIRVFRMSVLWMDLPREWTFEEGFQRVMSITWDKFIEECSYIQTVLIMDEVQLLFGTHSGDSESAYHGGSVFWKQFKLCLQAVNLQIVAFAAYGYKRAWDSSSSLVTPCALSDENTWGFSDVQFTKDEFEDYVSRFCKVHLGLKGDDSELVQQYVAHTTGYHPGLVACFMKKINTDLNVYIKDKQLTFERIFCYLNSSTFYIAIGNNARMCAALHGLTTEEIALCDEVFRGPTQIRRGSDEGSRLIRTGLLSLEGQVLSFTAPYLRTLYLQERYGTSTRPRVPPTDFKSFLIGVFTKIRADTLRASCSVGKDGRLLERAWQMEFYRAAASLLPLDVHISPDAGAGWGSHGYLDFWVNDDRCWGIELLRDGSDAHGHQNRCQSGGIYERIMNSAKQWAIIDIRNPKLRDKPPVYSSGQNWINVYCGENWEKVYIDTGEAGEEITVVTLESKSERAV